jgi:hypothetical protein
LAEQFRRTDPRYERRLEVEMTADGNRHLGHSRNISLGGMFVIRFHGLRARDVWALNRFFQS